MVVEWIVGPIVVPIVVKGVEMIINYLTKNPDARESSELAELRSQVEFLKIFKKKSWATNYRR
ncbi:MAG: hypothetical protein N2V77_04340 [Canidatus Methanoxibalbensis ujae]|nr:hypothetical protein [Candidatus Methanoxibalbensis ujae]